MTETVYLALERDFWRHFLLWLRRLCVFPVAADGSRRWRRQRELPTSGTASTTRDDWLSQPYTDKDRAASASTLCCVVVLEGYLRS